MSEAKKAAAKPEGLALLRAPFPSHQVSKLPKPTKAQTDAVRADFKRGIRCQLCGTWHHPEVVHLDYVGHAALTDRLLDCDPNWNWEPAAGAGVPALDGNMGMWIRLTVCGVTRLGYGHAQGKTGGDAIKEVIGDALRNAAMRFGAALDLWHKGDLHLDDDLSGDDEEAQKPAPARNERPASGVKPAADLDAEVQRAIDYLNGAETLDELKARWGNIPASPAKADARTIAAKDARRDALTPPPAAPADQAPLLDDEIPF